MGRQWGYRIEVYGYQVGFWEDGRWWPSVTIKQTKAEAQRFVEYFQLRDDAPHPYLRNTGIMHFDR